MNTDEIILLLAVGALALALLVVVVVPRLRGKTGPSHDVDLRPVPPLPPPSSISEPSVRKPTVATASPPVPHQAAVMVCPTCRRQYAAGLRFCPYDARLLVPDGLAGRRSSEPASKAREGKICPTCARRYDSLATVCGRDGSALASVN